MNVVRVLVLLIYGSFFTAVESHNVVTVRVHYQEIIAQGSISVRMYLAILLRQLTK